MTRGRKAALGAGIVVLVLVLGVWWYLRPIAPIATGYPAKHVCSGVFVSGRPVDALLLDLPDNPLVPLLRVRVDESEGTATTTLAGLWPSTAYHTPGRGCTLAEARPGFAHRPMPEGGGDDPWPAGEGPPDPPEDVDLDALEAALDAAFAEDDPDGLRRGTRAIVVVRDGALLAERYADGITADTPLLGWSMTKSLASAAVGRLVALGALDLDDTLERQEWEAGDPRRGITVEHLLQMTDGLDFEEVYEPDTDATRMLFTPNDAAAYTARQPLAASPGTRWHYSSGTTNLLCDAARRASGSDEFLHELVLEPLGMTSAVVEPDASGLPLCSSFGWASARDWARFGQWYLDDGVWEGERLLPEGWVAYSTTPVQAEGAEPYGAKWWLNTPRADGTRRMPDVPEDAFWASGNEGQQVVVIPSADLVVVRLGSSQHTGIAWGLEPLLRGVLDAVDG